MSKFELDATKLKKVTRFEVIDAGGRAYVEYDARSVELVFQDDGQTLKVFVKPNTAPINH